MIPRAAIPAALLLALAGCQAAADLLYEPPPDDPLDGYAGTLAEAGVNTELDWGPKQDYLLSGYKTLREEHAKLQRRHDELQTEHQNLGRRLEQADDLLARERKLRAQAEAEGESLRQKRRELEAQILGLGIEKSRLEQAALRERIAALQRSLDEIAAASAAAAPPAGNR